jgi:CRISPR system Cascade subunit CasC
MFVEIHILQNFAPSNLNRDDTNSPKDCTFGGFRRARVSSQCLKRAIRKDPTFQRALGDQLGLRTKRVHERLALALTSKGRDAESAARAAKHALAAMGFKLDGEATAVLLFLAEDEIRRWADVIDSHFDALVATPAAEGATDAASAKPAKGKKPAKGSTGTDPNAVKALKHAMAVASTGAVDVALFGRMVAENTDMSVDASCQVAHAISTHAVQMEMDFFTAVDDLQPKGDTGAGMMGVVEFNSACFYRYAVIDTEQLRKNLGADPGLVADAVLAFCKAAVAAIPTGKQNSFAAQNPPDWVRVEVRDGQSPRSLVNAFAQPVRPNRAEPDLVGLSLAKAEAYATDLAAMLGDEPPRFTGTATTRRAGETLPKLWAGLTAALAGAA